MGATNVRVAAADLNGNILLKHSEKTVGKSGIDVVNQVIGMSDMLLGSLKLRREDVKSIGIGSIGPIDLKKGLIVNPPNLRVGVIPIVEEIRKCFNVPVRLLNDCVAAVLGEKEFGAGRGLDNMVYITISTGIGSGVIVDGHLLLGKDGNAHEMGHTVVDKDGLLTCGCGRRGHWEAYCSGRGIVSYSRILLKEWGIEFEKCSLSNYSQGDISKMTPEVLFKAAKEGDELALKILDKVGLLNAIGFANAINAYDPELITVGGSIALYNSEFILKPIMEHVSEYALNRLPEIMITPLGGDIVLYGALVAAIESDF
ncbi:MAG: ROK family protein [Candidatus Brockarchaeota archaeon]|nr:ROK family protein [Candidatus Brockarchaeota archaeon]